MAEQFRELQYAFAAHLRNPDTNPAPEGVEESRLAIYRDLFFNNAKSLLAGTFPVLHRILGGHRWEGIIRDYYHRHVSHTPLFLEVPQEFLAYLNEEFDPAALPGEWPAFIKELAHYEWVELAVSVDPCDIETENFSRDGNILDGIPVLSPVAWPLAYEYPVHRISPEFQPEAPGEQPAFLVVYRKRNDEVGFTEINAVTARLLELMQQNETLTGREMLEAIAEELGHPNPAAVVAGGADILADLKAQDIVLGTRS